MSQTSTFGHNLGLGWKFPTLPSEERTNESSQTKLLLPWVISVSPKKRKEKERKSIDQRLKKSKRKEKKKKGSWNPTMFERCAELSERKKIVTMTWLKPEGCVM